MRIRVSMTGKSAHMQHNIRLANPDDSIAKQIASFTSKRRKTEEDRQEIARLEWFGSLYVSDGAIVVPTGNIRRCWQEAAKITKRGKDIVRGVSSEDIYVPLLFAGRERFARTDGTLDLDRMYSSGQYSDITLVSIRGQRTPRCRPFFQSWGVVSDWTILPQVIDPDEAIKVIKLAGTVEGLGDNRVNGYGRYEAGFEVLAEDEEIAA